MAFEATRANKTDSQRSNQEQPMKQRARTRRSKRKQPKAPYPELADLVLLDHVLDQDQDAWKEPVFGYKIRGRRTSGSGDIAFTNGNSVEEF